MGGRTMRWPNVGISNDVTYGSCTMSTVSGPLPWLCRASICVVILVMLLDGAIKLISWSIVVQTMDRIGHGSSEYLARVMGVVCMCVPFCAFPPTSFVGAIVTGGYLGNAVLSHLAMDGLMASAVLSGGGLVTVLLAGFSTRDKGTRLSGILHANLPDKK